MKILAIESSCDETAAAVIGDGPTVLSNVVASQIDIHKEFGGVVPEVAARAHIESIIPVIREALSDAKIELTDLDYIAVTNGPGLIGSLVVGVETAKALSVASGVPVLPINHLEGHVYANFIRKMTNDQLSINKVPEFPLLALLVSGGHTMLILMEDHQKYQVVGQTRDDAAGEAFDKGAKILGLGYPGGPIISKTAENGDPSAYPFPMIDLTEAPKRNAEGFMEKPETCLDFSFSGIKTSLITKVKTAEKLTETDTANLAASFQKAIVDNLVQNSVRAVKKYHPKTFILSGGVAANKLLRETLRGAVSEVSPETEYIIPSFEYCTDNAAMIGAVAYFADKKTAATDFVAEPNLRLK